jgi:hypothetical protein
LKLENDLSSDVPALSTYELSVLTNVTGDEPTISEVSPASSAVGSDTALVITGTNFVFSPLAELCPYQENTCGSSCRQLHNTSWISSELLQATVPTDLERGEYCLAVTNPAGASDMLPNAFTVSDAYEANDSCEQASSIPADGTIQIHNFHEEANQDWVSFQATAGVEYLIEGRVPPDAPTDLILEAYTDCDGVPDAQEPPFSADIRYQIVSPVDGPIYLRLFNQETTTYGAEVEYHLSVRTLDQKSQHGALIIVAGKYEEDDPLQSNIHKVTNHVYQLFRSQGHPSDQIYYLATDLNLDADGDGMSDVDALANNANLQSAITDWATNYVGTERALTLFLMDHGEYDKLHLDGPANEWLTPGQLDSWLSEVEDETGAKVNVLLEACQVGSFIDPEQTISKTGRVIVAATDASAPSYASEEGALFSDAMFSALAQGMTVKAAFDEAVWAIEQRPQVIVQNPWLDSDGNGIPNQPSDDLEAEQRGFAISGAFPSNQWVPYITQASIKNVSGTGGQIWAEVLDDEQVEQVWAVVYPPSYQPPESSEEIVPEPERIPLSKGNPVDHGAEYTIDYTQFTEAGTYQIVIYAQDDQALEARPLTINLQVAGSTPTPTLTPSATNTPMPTNTQTPIASSTATPISTPTPTQMLEEVLFLPLVTR